MSVKCGILAVSWLRISIHHQFVLNLYILIIYTEKKIHILTNYFVWHGSRAPGSRFDQSPIAKRVLRSLQCTRINTRVRVISNPRAQRKSVIGQRQSQLGDNTETIDGGAGVKDASSIKRDAWRILNSCYDHLF